MKTITFNMYSARKESVSRVSLGEVTDEFADGIILSLRRCIMDSRPVGSDVVLVMDMAESMKVEGLLWLVTKGKGSSTAISPDNKRIIVTVKGEPGKMMKASENGSYDILSESAISV